MKTPIISTTISGTYNSGRTTMLIQTVGDILKEYEDKKVLVLTTETSAPNFRERMFALDCGEDPKNRSQQHHNLYIVEFDPIGTTREDKDFIEFYDWVVKNGFDVLAVDDAPMLAKLFIMLDKERDIQRHYYYTQTTVQPAKQQA